MITTERILSDDVTSAPLPSFLKPRVVNSEELYIS